MGIFDKLFNSGTPLEQEKKKREKEEKKIAKEIDKKMDFKTKKSECRIMLRDCKAYFEEVIHKEVVNARKAQQLGIDPTLNKNHFSDAMRGLECVERADWYLDSITAENELQGALILLNKSLKSMDKLDGGTKTVNSYMIKKRISELYDLDEIEEDATVLDPTDDYIYKMDNGLFENMVAGMSYEEAKKAARSDLAVGGEAVKGVPNFDSIFDAPKTTAASGSGSLRREQTDK